MAEVLTILYMDLSSMRFSFSNWFPVYGLEIFVFLPRPGALCVDHSIYFKSKKRFRKKSKKTNEISYVDHQY